MQQFARTKTREIELYNQFNLQGLKEPFKAEFHRGSVQGIILEDDHLAEEVMKKVSQKLQREITRKHVLKAVCSLLPPPFPWLSREGPPTMHNIKAVRRQP